MSDRVMDDMPLPQNLCAPRSNKQVATAEGVLNTGYPTKQKEQLDSLGKSSCRRAGDGDRTRDNHLGKVELYH